MHDCIHLSPWGVRHDRNRRHLLARPRKEKFLNHLSGQFSPAQHHVIRRSEALVFVLPLQANRVTAAANVLNPAFELGTRERDQRGEQQQANQRDPKCQKGESALVFCDLTRVNGSNQCGPHDMRKAAVMGQVEQAHDNGGAKRHRKHGKRKPTNNPDRPSI